MRLRAALLGLTMAATAVWIACGSATGALFALLLFSAVALWTERVDDPRAGGPMQLRLAPGGFTTRRGFGPVHWKPWCPRWRLRLVAGPFHRPTLLVTRPLLGPFAIDHPLRFSLNVPVHEAHDLATRVRQWLAKERA